MPNDHDIALLLQAQYDGGACFDAVEHTAGVDWAIKHFDDCMVISFEGSHDIPDWERDFSAEMIRVPGIGGVHGGAYEGLPETLTAAMPYLPKDKLVKVVGHSLGGMEAHIFTAMLAQVGYTLLETVVFGAPRPGDAKLASVLAPFGNRSYWNWHDEFYHDFIGDVPRFIPLVEPYIIPRQRILIDEQPPADDPWGFLSYHHIHLYIDGVEKLCASS